ncbi:GNAT family N-acetyltransferase [Nesterenkonia muleiensis]|uniref:GNAT family N-acetyltransferase n=1 Tax=Nesterenkonia muleiensis TaxID=2282648 RepID=UPI000E712875|nr:GNAT family protein [Nesterenkonia muleiensis]
MTIEVSAVRFTHLRPDDPDGAREIVTFISSHSYPFHMRTEPSVKQAEENLAGGDYGHNPEHYETDAAEETDRRGWWAETLDGERLGIVILEDLTDGAPLFDLRLAERHRGRGWGVPILKELTRLVFETYPEVDRFEGQTREDNIAMRKVFLRCGFLKEAHYRRGWPVEGNEPVASVAYAILRQDWATGSTTTFEWEDLNPDPVN